MIKVYDMTSDNPVKTFADITDHEFWGLAVRYPANQMPTWFDPAWTALYEDEDED